MLDRSDGGASCKESDGFLISVRTFDEWIYGGGYNLVL